MQKEHIEQLGRSIERIEKAVLKSVLELPYYQRFNTLPGVGKILGKSAGDFASYCRAVASKRTSNEKGKGDNNRKCGNKHLGLGRRICRNLRGW